MKIILTEGIYEHWFRNKKTYEEVTNPRVVQVAEPEGEIAVKIPDDISLKDDIELYVRRLK